MTKAFDASRLSYFGAVENDGYTDHEFSTKDCDLITLSFPPNGEQPYSTVRVSTERDGDFGELVREMPMHFTEILLSALPA